jgi:hypothetical protein
MNKRGRQAEMPDAIAAAVGIAVCLLIDRTDWLLIEDNQLAEFTFVLLLFPLVFFILRFAIRASLRKDNRDDRS